MNTTENKLIAEFLQAKEVNGEYDMYGVILSIEDGEYEKHFFRLEEMRFHDDWNWLMQVVDKIESIVFDDNNSFNVTIGSTNYCVIQDANGEVYDNVTDNGESKLLTTLYACVEFIKWYNQQHHD